MPLPKRSTTVKVLSTNMPIKRGGKRSRNVTSDSTSSKVNTKKTKTHLEETEGLSCKESVNDDSKVNRLKDVFFDIPCIELSKKLLGKVIVRKHKDGSVVKGRIVETECYAGGDDKASCSYGGKETPKNKPTFMKPGTAFVYMTYGMYHCINISSRGAGAAVLIRAVEPIEGVDKIIHSRQNFGNKKDSSKPKVFKLTELCNGPSKFCIGFNIDKNTVNEKDVCTWDEMWIERDGKKEDIRDEHIVKSKRIGIDMVGEPWASKPLRFYIYESSLYVSKRDKRNEELVEKNLSKSE